MNKAAQQLGRRARGKPKHFTPEELDRRRARVAQARLALANQRLAAKLEANCPVCHNKRVVAVLGRENYESHPCPACRPRPDKMGATNAVPPKL